MKCPKCDYLGFEASDRCRNCGYEFALARPAPADSLLDVSLSPAGAEPLIPSPDAQPFARPPLDLDRVFKAAAASGTALEINSGYPRLDLHDINARNAIAAGCTLTINTDTHTTIFEEINWGIGVARRAWVEPRHVLNCMKLPELKKFLASKRDRA